MEYKTYVIGDIHGEVDKLIECLKLVNFDYNNDTLIQLGDVCDRGSKTFECVEELLKIKNLISIKGNHDVEFFNGLHNGIYKLYNQGCMETLKSYIHNCNPDRNLCVNCDFELSDMSVEHYRFWKNQLSYYIDKNNNFFVHGGFNRHRLIEEHDEVELSHIWWDRDLIQSARSYESMLSKIYPFKNKNKFKEIFIGHTPVQHFEKTNTPTKYANVWNLDTGCGKGKFPLTIMDVNTKIFKQSKI